MRSLYFTTIDSGIYEVALPDDMTWPEATRYLMRSSFPNDKNCSNFRMGRSEDGDIVIFDTTKICAIWCGAAEVSHGDLTCETPLHLEEYIDE